MSDKQEERRGEVDLAVLNKTVESGFDAVNDKMETGFKVINEKIDNNSEQNTREHTKLFETHDAMSGVQASLRDHKIAIAGVYALIGAVIVAAIALWP